MMHERFRGRQVRPIVGGGGFNGGEPPDEGGTEGRLRALERSVAVIKANIVTKADISEVRADIHKAIADINKVILECSRWNHVSLVAMFGAFVLGVIGLLVTIWNVGKPQAPATATHGSAPVVIQVPAAPAPLSAVSVGLDE